MKFKLFEFGNFEIFQGSLHNSSIQKEEEGNILNRIVRVTERGFEYEADPRHVELIVNELKLKDAKGVCSPGTKDEGTTNAYEGAK